MTLAKRPPPVRLRPLEPLQDWFVDVDGNRYSVARLLDDTKHLPVFDVPLAALDLTGEIWNGPDMLGLAYHVRACMKADLSCPILIAWDGSIADGRHRILAAIAKGRATLPARRMTWKPEPDRPAEAP